MSQPTLNLAHKSIWHREVEFALLLKLMESRGVRIDQAKCRSERAIGSTRMWQLQKSFGGLNPGSHKDMEKLFRKAGIPLLEDHRTKRGNYSFNKEAMEEYDDLLELRADSYSDLAKDILEWRGWNKTVSSNYDPYLALVSPDGRLRPNFNQAGTKTGRLSCSDPNLQQIPRNSDKRWNGQLKSVFVPKPGFVLVANDYSQLEFRLGAAYARERGLMEIFNRSLDKERYSKIERDIFFQMCEDLGLPLTKEHRQDMKTLTYAKNFGAGVVKIAIMLGEDIPQWVRDNYRKPDRDCSPDRRAMYNRAWEYIETLDAFDFFKSWEAKYRKMVDCSKSVNDIAAKRGYINYWTQRRRHFHGDDAWQAHKAYNSLIQGGGAEIVKSAMLRLGKEIDNPDCLMLLQVHDSVLFEIREGKVDYYLPMIQEVMARVHEEFDFGVYFATEEEYWGLAA